MEQQEPQPIASFRTRRIFVWIRAFLYGFLGLGLLLAGIVVAARLPQVQTWLADRLLEKVERRTGFRITVRHVDVNLYNQALLDSVTVYDLKNRSMIFLEHVQVDFSPARLITRDVTLDAAIVQGGHLNVVTYPDSGGQVNMEQFVHRMATWINPDTARSKNPSTFRILNAGLSGLTFSFTDLRRGPQPQPFDWYHFSIDSIVGLVDGFRARGDTLEMQVNRMRGQDRKTGLPVHELTTFFRYTRYNMALEPLSAYIGHSYLADSLRFSYAKSADMSDIINKVTMRVSLRNSRLNYRDLALFGPGIGRYDDSVRISGVAQGKIKAFRLSRMKAHFGHNSYVQGQLAMRGLPDLDHSYLDLELKQPSHADPKDLLQYTPPASHEYLARMGVTDVEGRYAGFFDNFTFDGTLYSALGNLKADFGMKLADTRTSTYQGDFHLDRFDVGAFSKYAKLGKITGKGRIQGRGFDLESVRAELVSELKSLDYNGYTYRNIRTDASLARRKFDGFLEIDDSAAVQGRANGLADFSKKDMVFDIDLYLKRARLRRTGWTKVPMNLTGYAYLNGHGSNIDDAEGLIRLDSFTVFKGRGQDRKTLFLDTLVLETLRQGSERLITLESPQAAGRVEGDFTFKTVTQDLEAALNDYGRIFHNRKAVVNRHSVYTPSEYTLSADITLKDFNPVLAMFVPDVNLAQNTRIEALLEKSSNLLVQSLIKADYLMYDNLLWDAPTLDLVTSKTLDSPNVLAALTLTSPTQRLGKLETKEWLTSGTWDGDQILFRQQLRQANDSNHAALNGSLAFEPGQAVARITGADVRLADTAWTIAPTNRITFDGQRFFIDSLLFASGSQRLDLEGVAGPGPADSITLKVDSLNLAYLDYLLPGPWHGAMNANLKMGALYTDPLFSGSLTVPDVVYKNQNLGRLVLDFKPQANPYILDVLAGITMDSAEVVEGGGTLTLNGERPIGLDFDLKGVPFRYLEPVLSGSASNFEGSTFGRLRLGNKLAEPELTGKIYVDKGGFSVDYLRTHYTFNDSITLGRDYISASGAHLYDGGGNRATLRRAVLRHQHFENFSVNLDADLESFQMLGTTYRDSKLYYGSAYGTGDLTIQGPLGNIFIGANIRSDKGTRIFLPISEAMAENAETQQFITFVGHRPDSSATVQAKNDSTAQRKVNLSGIRMNFNIELTPDAYGEIILDKRTGDMIRVYGRGLIKLGIDTRGDFTMYGQYNITQGDYRFTFSNVINKEFKILNGSTITWNGDPAQALLDINARYSVYVSLKPLIPQGDPNADLPESSRRYESRVNMRLTGQMLHPTIGLAVDVPNGYPNSLNTYVTSFQSQMLNNEQELNKQVFSLLILRSLQPVTSAANQQQGNSAVSNLGEMLSNQLSNWLSQVNKDLEVGVNLGGIGNAGGNEFQLRLSYTALDGRLRVTRNGSFTDTRSEATAASLAGDWSIDYILTRDGKLRAKAFHRTNQSFYSATAAAATLPGNQTSQGASLVHTQSFDRLSELLPWLYRKKKPPVFEPEMGDDEPDPEGQPISPKKTQDGRPAAAMK